MQAKTPSRKRRKHCQACHELFVSDPRTKGKQRYCSKTECQTQRQRHNEKDWRERNPDCLAYQQEQSRQWYKDHPRYSRQRRANDLDLLENNRDQTRERMRKTRGEKMFDKSKVILTELTGGKEDNCYLTQGGRGLYVRLTKASPLSKTGSLRDNRRRFKRVVNRMPKGKLYHLSTMFD